MTTTVAVLAGALAITAPTGDASPETASGREPAPSDARPTTAVERLSAEDPLLDEYYTLLARAGLADATEATLEEVGERLARGQDQYVRGNALGSAIILYDLTHHPRYETFADLPEMTSAWYHLGVALASHGADLTAQSAYAQVLHRGPSDPYFTPALRRSVDIALQHKDYARGLAELDAQLLDANGRPIALEGVDLDERRYLQARVAHTEGRFEEALAGYAAIGPRSRFSTAAAYLQGVIHARRKDYRSAEQAFCNVIEGPNQATASFYVDRRYFDVRDLAQLGLGRVAHEERRHGHAFYHYFQIPQDSQELPRALFEAAWTMAEDGEYAVARGLVADLRERFPDSPQAVEARLLEAMLELYDCDFRTAELSFTRFIDDMAPVTDHIDEIRKDPARVRALHRELEALRRGSDRHGADAQAHRLLLAMLSEQATYERLAGRAETLRAEAEFAGALSGEIERLVAALAGEKTTTERAGQDAALAALEAADVLERGIADLERRIREAQVAGASATELQGLETEVRALRSEVATLRGDARSSLVALPDIGTAPTGDIRAALARDRARVERARGRALALATELDDEAARVAAAELGQLQRRIDDLMGEARMGRIDAVLGAKKKLEIEVQDMAAGKFPSELFGKLQIEGMVGDDEEFWPYEGEYWADEYEGLR